MPVLHLRAPRPSAGTPPVPGRHDARPGRARPPGRHLGALAALTAVGLFAGAGVAAAHVSVTASSAASGSYSLLTFRVPNESPTAGTVAVKVEIPADHPLASVSYEAVPGWTTTVRKDPLPSPVTQGDLTLTEAVSSVTWTADAGTDIGPGEFARFVLSVGPLPDTEAMTFPVDQTYSDGTVVRWADPENADGTEAEHPVPSFTITPATAAVEAGAHHGGAAAATTTPTGAGAAAADTTSTTTTAAAASDDADSSARTLGIVGIVVAAVALLTAAIGLRRPRLSKDSS